MLVDGLRAHIVEDLLAHAEHLFDELGAQVFDVQFLEALKLGLFDDWPNYALTVTLAEEPTQSLLDLVALLNFLAETR